MNPCPKKVGSKAVNPDNLIKLTLHDNFFEDKSNINNKLIYKELALISKPQYSKMMDI